MTDAANDNQQQGPDIESLSFEQAQAELERIVERLEDQHTGLDEALTLWERGEALHAYCQRKLDHAAHRIERLQVTSEEAAAVVAESGDDFAPAHGSAPAHGPAHGPAQAQVQVSARQEEHQSPAGAAEEQRRGDESQPDSMPSMF